MAAARWSWVETQALLQRLHQPTVATVAAEYANINSMTDWMRATLTPQADSAPEVSLPREQFTTLMQCLCSMAKPLLLLFMDSALARHGATAALSVGMLLSLMANLLESWVNLAADGEAVKQQIAEHTAGMIPDLGKLMTATAATLGNSSAQHSDIKNGLHFLTLWKGLANIWPESLLRSSRSSGSSKSLQETVLPACDLAVSLLKAWPLSVAGAATTSSSSSSGGALPDGAVVRWKMTSVVFMMSDVLLRAIQNDLLINPTPMTNADVKFTKELSASAAVQHLLLLQTACSCHVLHKARQGLSPLKIRDAAAAVSGSKDVAAAAAAGETAVGSNGSRSSNRSSGSSGSRGAKQQQYLPVPAHHSAVLDLLLVPVDSMKTEDQSLDITSCANKLVMAINTTAHFLMGIHTHNPLQQGQRMGQVQRSSNIPVELCAPLHCMLAEAAALDARTTFIPHIALMFMQALQDIYFTAKVGSDAQATPAAVNAAALGYSSALTASLQLLGPAVLRAYKHGDEGDSQLPPGGGGCPLGDDGTSLKGALMRDAALNLFGSVTVKIAGVPAAQDVITAAFRQRPFTTAAVCEAAVRGAARHNPIPAGGIRMFASLATNACYEITAGPSSSARSSVVTAAASDSSSRDALLLQFALITTQLKCAASSCGSTCVFSGLSHHVGLTNRTVLKLGKVIERAVGLNSDAVSGDTPSSSRVTSSSSSSSEEQRVRVRIMLPWIHLAGHCLFFAGSQLLLAQEDPSVTRAPGLNASAVNAMEQVLMDIPNLLQMVSAQIQQLQQLQPEGTCILQGRPAAAHKVYLQLVNTQIAAVTEEWENVLTRWKVSAGLLKEMMAAQGQTGSDIAWGFQLQQMLRTAVRTQAAGGLRDVGAAVCAEFPVKLCCNNPGCTSMAKVGEMLLGSSCSGCKAARYCSKGCLDAAWKMGHSKVCKRITKAAARGPQ